MRKIALVLVGALLGGLAWEVGSTAPAPLDTLVVCQRPGTDLRSPSTNGSCPSGYSKVEITETAPPDLVVYHAGPATLSEWPVDVGCCPQRLVVELDLPAGTYELYATGWADSIGDDPQNEHGLAEFGLECQLRALEDSDPFFNAAEVLDKSRLSKEESQSDDGASGALSGVVSVDEEWKAQVTCEIYDATDKTPDEDFWIGDATWDITAKPAETIIQQDH